MSEQNKKTENENLTENEKLIAALDRPNIKKVSKPAKPETTKLIVYGRDYTDEEGNVIRDDEGNRVRDVYVAYLKEPNRHVIQAAMSEAQPTATSKGKTIDAGEIILKSTWVKGHGNEEILNDDYLLVGACITAYQTVEFADAELKKN